MPRLGINAALSSFFYFAIKIYNKQKKYPLPLCKSRPPSGSHRRLLCFPFSLPFFFPKNPLLFTLQRSLLYARPPLRPSPAQLCTAARGSHHFQVCLHCFPCFRSQHDQTINRQLKKKKKGDVAVHCAVHCCGSSVRRDETDWCVVWFLRFTAPRPQRE